jgi:hypothetical protein
MQNQKAKCVSAILVAPCKLLHPHKERKQRKNKSCKQHIAFCIQNPASLRIQKRQRLKKPLMMQKTLAYGFFNDELPRKTYMVSNILLLFALMELT